MTIDKHTALIVVDVQRDFCPGGALPVRKGDQVVPLLNRYVDKFTKAGAPIFFTRDWHPADHISFKAQGGPWPPHCVQGTEGAKFHPDLKIPPDAEIVSKADRKDLEAYSGFQGTNLVSELRDRDIKRVLVGGLATDYCVKSTVLDALREGFEVFHLDDASRGVDVQADDSQKALREMESHGAKRTTLGDLRVPIGAAQNSHYT